MIVLVTGGRDYKEYGVVANTLAGLQPTKIVQGHATGADHLARVWAGANHITCVSYPADWDTYGKAAGPVRNQKMLDSESIDMVVAFPGGTGTADMVNRANKANIPVTLVP